jgi:hypothetical protein
MGLTPHSLVVIRVDPWPGQNSYVEDAQQVTVLYDEFSVNPSILLQHHDCLFSWQTLGDHL